MIRLAFLLRDLAKGGAEKIASDLLLHLPETIEKHLFLYRNRTDYPYTGRLVDLNVPETQSMAGKASTLLHRRRAIRRAKQDHTITHTLSLLNGPNVMNVLTRVQDRVVVCAHNTQSVKYQGLSPHAVANRLAIRCFYPWADRIVAVSEGIRQDLTDHFGIASSKITVIHNPYDTDTIQLRAQEGVNEYESIFDRPVLVNTGRLTEAKGQSRLLRIFREVKTHVPKAALMVLGDGEMRDDLVRLAKALGLTVFAGWENKGLNDKADVFFPGFVSNPFRFLARSTLFVFPSLWEGFPNALVEAMTCGLPCIASDCPSGPRELLAPGTPLTAHAEQPLWTDYGILMPVPPGHDFSAAPATPEETMWAAAIVELLKNPQKRLTLGQAARERALTFDVKRIVPNYAELLGMNG